MSRLLEADFLRTPPDAMRKKQTKFKVARYNFSGSIPPKFERKVRRQKQSLGKIAPTVVLAKDENLL